MIATRIAVYVGTDDYGVTDSSEIPLPDDITPSRHIVRCGIPMELRCIISREEVEADERAMGVDVRNGVTLEWAADICRPVTK